MQDRLVLDAPGSSTTEAAESGHFATMFAAIAKAEGNRISIKTLENSAGTLTEQAHIDHVKELLNDVMGDPAAKIPDNAETLNITATVECLRIATSFYWKLERAAQSNLHLSEQSGAVSSALLLNNIFDEKLNIVFARQTAGLSKESDEFIQLKSSQRSNPAAALRETFIEAIVAITKSEKWQARSFILDRIEKMTVIPDEFPGINLRSDYRSAVPLEVAGNPFAARKGQSGWSGPFHRYNALTSFENREEIKTLYNNRQMADIKAANDYRERPGRGMTTPLILAEQMEQPEHRQSDGNVKPLRSWMKNLLAGAIGKETLPPPEEITAKQRDNMLKALGTNAIIRQVAAPHYLSALFPFVYILTGINFSSIALGRSNEREDNPFPPALKTLHDDFNRLISDENRLDVIKLWERKDGEKMIHAKYRSDGKPGLAHTRAMALMKEVEKGRDAAGKPVAKPAKPWMQALIDAALASQTWQDESTLSKNELIQQKNKQKKLIKTELTQDPTIRKIFRDDDEVITRHLSELFSLIFVMNGIWLGR